MIDFLLSVVCPSVFMSVTHAPASPAWPSDEIELLSYMSSDRDAYVVTHNNVFDWGPSPQRPGRRDLGVEIPLEICIACCGQTVTYSRMVTIESLNKVSNTLPHLHPYTTSSFLKVT